MDENIRQPLPRVGPLAEGIYTFPARPANLAVWLLLAFGLTVLALIGCGLHGLIGLMYSVGEKSDFTGPSMIIFRGGWNVFTSLCVFALLFSLHPAACFLRVVEETAAGIDEVGWPKDPWYEYLGNCLHLLWLIAFCLAIAFLALALAAVALPLTRAWWWSLALTLAWLLFPIVLLSTLAGGAWWTLFDLRVLAGLARKPIVASFLYVNGLLIYVPCVVLGYFTILEFNWFLVPLIGFVWPTALLSYARVLGRTGFVLTHEGKKKSGKKKRKKATEEDDEA